MKIQRQKTEIEGSTLLWALCAMGHPTRVFTWPDHEHFEQIIEAAYWPPGGGVPLTVSGHVATPVAPDLVAAGIDATIRSMLRLIPEDVLGGANAVQEHLQAGGTLPCELIGGHRDGERIKPYIVDGNGWPPMVIYVPPLPRGDVFVAFVDPAAAALTDAPLVYERGRLDPALMAWRYTLRPRR